MYTPKDVEFRLSYSTLLDEVEERLQRHVDLIGTYFGAIDRTIDYMFMLYSHASRLRAKQVIRSRACRFIGNGENPGPGEAGAGAAAAGEPAAADAADAEDGANNPEVVVIQDEEDDQIITDEDIRAGNPQIGINGLLGEENQALLEELAQSVDGDDEGESDSDMEVVD